MYYGAEIALSRSGERPQGEREGYKTRSNSEPKSPLMGYGRRPRGYKAGSRGTMTGLESDSDRKKTAVWREQQGPGSTFSGLEKTQDKECTLCGLC